jgi:glycosyltransferase involved in cell wall biosynthesis
MQYLRQGGQNLILAGGARNLVMGADMPNTLGAATDLGNRLADFLANNPAETLAFNHPALFAVGNDGRGFAGQDRVWSKPAIGCAAIEHDQFSTHGRDILRRYDQLIAISCWNEQLLRGLTMAPVTLCWQGVDSQCFYPQPRGTGWPGRFVIFSGGKFEFRKAQDLVLAAFKRFRSMHPEALLVCAWQTPYAPDVATFTLAGHCETVPQPDGQGGLKIADWLQHEGLPRDSFTVLPYTPNQHMPEILANCDVALFPNRCEGGTNLVAMEAMACGVPSIIAANTGQLDLIDLFSCQPLRQQGAVKVSDDYLNVQGWGESNLEEIVAALEVVYTDSSARAAAMAAATRLRDFDWRIVSDRLLHTIAR